MSLSAIDERTLPQRTGRIDLLKAAVQRAKPGVCAERALIWTDYFRDRRHRRKPRAIQAAEALSEVLRRKTVRIYPHELVVGNFSSKRVGGAIYPELHGVAMLREIATFPVREVNPLDVTPEEIAALSRITCFWAPRMLGARAYRAPWKTARLTSSAENEAKAEQCFREAIDVARRQKAKSFELSAAASLARLWQKQGRKEEAHRMLSEIYGWFTEGFATRDLKEAKALLDELS